MLVQEKVLRAVEGDGSSLNAETVGKTMDSMYESGKLTPAHGGYHAGKLVARFYNVTGLQAEVEIPGLARTLRVPPAGSVNKYPYRYDSVEHKFEPTPGVEVRVHVGGHPPVSYVTNGDERQVIFLERNYLPEEQAFEANVMTGGLSAALDKLAEWKKHGGKKHRREATAQFQEMQAVFQDQVQELEAAIGQARARLVVDEMEAKITAPIQELEGAHDFTGLVNQAATCYMNSLLQAMYMTPELRFALYRWQWDAGRGESKADSIPYQMQKLFCLMQSAESRAVETKALTASFGWTGADAFQQQDVNELFNVLCDSLENNFRGTRGRGVIESLFEGREKHYLRCSVCGFESSRQEKFRAVMMNLKQFGDPRPIASIEEGLDNWFTSERLNGENQWHCERCNAKVDAEKGVGLSKVPYLLSINMTRFVYNWEIDRAEKLTDRVSFPETLDVAKYLVPTESLAESGGGDGANDPHVDFGKDGASILMRGRSAIGLQPQAPDALNYDLYAILVHSGGVGGESNISTTFLSHLAGVAPSVWFEP